MGSSKSESRMANCTNCKHFSETECELGKKPDAETRICGVYEISDAFKDEIAKKLAKEVMKEHSLEFDVLKKK
jgi:hypothetical protein